MQEAKSHRYSPAIAWGCCALLGIGYFIAVFDVWFGCDATLIWLVFGPPTLLAAVALSSAIWGARRQVVTAGVVTWVVLGIASALCLAFCAFGLLYSLSVPCGTFGPPVS